jgi:UDP-N-acetylmuramate--alanine ligase
MTRVVHLVGIGGAGMSAIARILHGRGELVTGSDRAESMYSRALEEMGIPVTYGHRAQNVQGASIVVASSAIPRDNVELEAARAQGIPVVGRDVFLPELISRSRSVAIAGAHGKTTTTGLIAWILGQNGLDPSFIAGGMVLDFGANARAGVGAHFVIEADEYDRTFLGLYPDIELITVVEHDHPDCYPSEKDALEAYQQFADQARERVFINHDDPLSESLVIPEEVRRTFGFQDGADWRAVDLQVNAAGGTDFLVVQEGETLGLARTRLPGHHNVKNALGALAVVGHLGVTFKSAREALSKFTGIGRRFEVLGESKGVVVVDDYAHHPTEIKATLQAARARFPEHVIWAVFEPHTYSRIRAFLDEFAASFQDADRVIVTEVYAARESVDPGLGGEEIARRIQHTDVRFIAGYPEAADYLREHVGERSVVITLSAGDANLVGKILLQKLDEGEIPNG